jgi:hypothetical protein
VPEKSQRNFGHSFVVLSPLRFGHGCSRDEITLSTAASGFDPKRRSVQNDRYIVIEVDVSRIEEEQLLDVDQRWFTEVFDLSPSTHVCIFRLGLF